MITQAKEQTSTITPSYEYKRGRIVNFLRIQFIRLLGLLPSRIAQKVFLAFSGEEDDVYIIFKNVTTWKALEALYTYKERENELSLTSIFWKNLLDNVRSMRNRLGLVKKELSGLIQELVKTGQSVRLLCVGSGSGRAVVETIASLNGEYPLIEMMLIDVDQTAIEFSKSLAEKYHINYTIRLTGNFFRLERDTEKFNPNIVELVGLLDYLDDRRAIFLLSEILRILAPEGYLITGNITPNPESPFVTKGVNWPMVYRTPEKLKALVADAGFLEKNIRVQQEPLGIHSIATCRKT